MNISKRRLSEYRKYSYFKDREIVSSMLIDDFEKSLAFCKKFPGKTFKTYTNETVLKKLEG